MVEKGISTYRVGFFQDLWWFLRVLLGKQKAEKKAVLKLVIQKFRIHWRKKSYWNGFLAEWHYVPEGVNHYTAGHGWTRKRALKRLGQYIVRDNLLKGE